MVHVHTAQFFIRQLRITRLQYKEWINDTTNGRKYRYVLHKSEHNNAPEGGIQQIVCSDVLNKGAELHKKN